MKKTALYKIVQALIIAGMAVGLLLIYLIVTNNAMLGWRQMFITVNGDTRSCLSGALAVLAVLGCEYIAYTLFRMMRSLSLDPFVVSNVRALRNMGFAALAVTALCLGTLFLIPVPLAVMAALPIGMCGLFSLVLASVFEKAVAFKEENDLTV